MGGTVISWERLDLIFVWGGKCEVVMYGLLEYVGNDLLTLSGKKYSKLMRNLLAEISTVSCSTRPFRFSVLIHDRFLAPVSATSTLRSVLDLRTCRRFGYRVLWTLGDHPKQACLKFEGHYSSWCTEQIVSKSFVD